MYWSNEYGGSRWLISSYAGRARSTTVYNFLGTLGHKWREQFRMGTYKHIKLG